MAMTLVEMLQQHAGSIPQKPAIVFRDNKLSYRELNDIVNRAANTLSALGIKPGDRVGLLLPRIPELVISFLAIAKVRAVAVPINFELTPKKIHPILNSTSPRCIIAHSFYLNLLRKSLPETLPIEIIAVADKGEKYLPWDEIQQRSSVFNPGVEIKDEDVVYLNYTSGSTGNSKGAVTTHAHIYWNTLASVAALGLTSDDVHLCMFAPFAHPHEIIARPLYLGGTMVLLDKLYPKSLAEAISRHKISCMMGLAPMYENLLGVLEHRAYDLSSLRIPESGGMYTRPELIARFRKKLGVPIIPVWGSTETTGIALANRPAEHIPPGSLGKPCNTYRVKIVNEKDVTLPAGEVGEMIFKGPAVVQEYYEYTTGEPGCFRNGWFYSGDLGRTDVDGNFYFVGRKSGMMKVAGLKVYPLEVELILMSHPAIKEAAVISSGDRLRGEVPRAIIVADNGGRLTEKEIMGFCKTRLAHYKLPKIVEIRASLPKTGSGKINKKALQKEHT